MQFLFRDHLLDTDLRELSREQVPVSVEPQVFDLVVHLMENRDRVVSKDELIDKIWHGRSVSESTLTSRINAARKAIGDSGANQALIRTIARKGFRFVGNVEAKSGAATAEPGRSVTTPHALLALPDRPAIAVLPFTNMSGDREQDYFSDGISEDIITALSKLRWFFVIARNSSFVYKGRAVHLNEIARELGVRYVLEGSVRRSGDRVRISAQLNDVSTGGHLWAERYDRELADIFAVQDEITEAIVAAIEPQLYAAESFRAQQKPPGSLDAWDFLMRALSHYWRITREDNATAQALLDQAITIDPAYGKALGLLATSHIFGAHMGWADMRTTVPVAEAAALAAVEADRDDAWAHHGLAYTYLFRRRFDDALAEFELGLEAQSEFRNGARLLRRHAVLCRTMAGRRCGCTPRAAAQPARSARGDLLWCCRLRPVHRPQLRGRHADGAGIDAAAGRFRWRAPRAHGGRRHVRQSHTCRFRAGRTATHSARHLARLDHAGATDAARRGPRALSRRISARGDEVTEIASPRLGGEAKSSLTPASSRRCRRTRRENPSAWAGRRASAAPSRNS
ncbi:TolB-like protein [Bradyrhizobium sp. GM24.11]